MICNVCGNDIDAHRMGCPATHPAYIALSAELADLRRQLAECQAQLAESVRIIERRRPGIPIDPDDSRS